MSDGKRVCIHCGELKEDLLGKHCNVHDLYYCWRCRGRRCPECEKEDIPNDYRLFAELGTTK